MYKTINGWTKAKMIKQIMKRNNGTRCVVGGVCLYFRDSDKNSCAVGAFIPRKAYRSAMDNSSNPYTATQLLRTFPQLEKYMPLEERALMRLQYEHDTCLEHKDNLWQRLIRWIEKNVEDAA
jgi:hypothetical protein